MPTSSVNNMYTSNVYGNGTSTTNAGSDKVADKSQLDKNGFLKLLTAQMSNQDPNSSQDPSQYFQTISQMSMVEQLTNLASQSAAQLTQGKVATAQNLLGKTVTYRGTDGLPVSGLVEKVNLAGTTPTITVGGKDGIDPSVLSAIQ
jgi:flagellar basal-body rod modification protein FlgD